MLSIGDFARLAQVSRRMLRHYDELGILTPARVDTSTGYRFYAVDQLADAHRIVALRDLGLGLEEIKVLVAEDVPVEQLRGMLRLRRADIASAIQVEQERLRRVEAHLDALERGAAMNTVDITIKHTDPVRAALSTYRAAGYGYENINPVFAEHLEAMTMRLLEQGLRLGVCVATYEGPDPSDEVLVHLGWEVFDQNVATGENLRVVELPVIEVASTIVTGPMHDVTSIYESMVRWLESSGYQLAGYSRELYHHLDMDETKQVTELQMPVVRAT